MHWHMTTLLICIYGVVKEFRPATPFLTPFLVSHYKNLTLEEVYGDIYPYWTYSYVVFLIPVFFLTDILRYKPIIILEAGCYVGTWALLVWGQGVRQMQLMQIIFGLSSAAEVSYYSYMYVVVEEKNFRRVTSYIRTAVMIGKLLAFSSAQLLISSGVGTYLMLNQISLAAVTITFFIALCLPGIPKQRADHVGVSDTEEPITRAEFERTKLSHGVKEYVSQSLKAFKIYKENHLVLKWSIWWALASCGMYQVYNYMQTLWMEMEAGTTKVQNGWAEFANTLMGAILSFSIQYLSLDWAKYGTATLCASSFLIAIILGYLSQATKVVVGYAGYVACSSTYHMLIAAASANIASSLTTANYGLVFGANTFVAVLLQTGLLFAVADSHGFNLPIREQFVVYAAYFAVVGVVFCVFSVISIIRRRKEPSPKPEEEALNA